MTYFSKLSPQDHGVLPYDLLCLVTVIVEEDQINTPTCSPGAFIRQYKTHFIVSVYNNTHGNRNIMCVSSFTRTEYIPLLDSKLVLE